MSIVSLCRHRSHLTKLTKDKNWHIFPNSFEANFDYFRLSTVRDEKIIGTVQVFFFNSGLKCC